MPVAIEVDRGRIAEFCRRWSIKGLAFFGSVLREGFSPRSDMDVLVSFEQGAHWTLLDFVAMEEEPAQLFGRRVDLVSRRGVEASRNHIRREAILSTAEPIYVSGQGSPA